MSGVQSGTRLERLGSVEALTVHTEMAEVGQPGGRQLLRSQDRLSEQRFQPSEWPQGGICRVRVFTGIAKEFAEKCSRPRGQLPLNRWQDTPRLSHPHRHLVFDLDALMQLTHGPDSGCKGTKIREQTLQLSLQRVGVLQTSLVPERQRDRAQRHYGSRDSANECASESFPHVAIFAACGRLTCEPTASP